MDEQAETMGRAAASIGPRRRAARGAFITLGLLLVAACNGQIFFTPAPVTQPGGQPDRPCNVIYPGGLCSTGDVCVRGTCYSPTQQPKSCTGGINGPCVGDYTAACVAGTCTPITVANACSQAQPSGLCPGGEVCVRGFCFVDDGQVTCSAADPGGACPAGQSCIGGACGTFFGNCGQTDFNGRCATWETCAEGTCVGPVAPDACSPAQPTGRCPAAEACVAGTCTAINGDNVCSPDNALGLCEGSAACADGGHCVAIGPGNACSATNPTGLCAGGGLCRGGSCIQTACNASGNGWQCAPNSWCDKGTCVPTPCDPVHPYGACVDTTLACVNGLCAEPTCSPQVPNGVCQGDLYCKAGACAVRPCDATHPTGPCPDPVNQICQLGQCQLRDCSAASPEGTCSRIKPSSCTNDPTYGCIFNQPSVCCDAALAGQTGCLAGSCAPPACSAQNPNGACPEGQICAAGACTTAPCSPFFPGGFCSAAGQQCLEGVCSRSGCATAGDPNAFCSPQICDTASNTCKNPKCSPAHTDGVCSGVDIGKACCTTAMTNSSDANNYNPACVSNVGSCQRAICSPQYPGGTCADPNFVCAAGKCARPPCSHPSDPNNAGYHGICGTNFSCANGACVLQPCGAGAPQGSCQSGYTCVPSGNSNACAQYVCGNQFPAGPCLGANAAKVCTNTGSGSAPSYACVTPPCGPSYPGGACSNPNQVCQGGACVQGPCSSSRPGGACPRSQTCTQDANNTSSYRCVLQPCSAADPNDSGTCPAGQVCCNNALVAQNYCSTTKKCVNTTCSSQFPFGQCANANQVCITSGSKTSCQSLCGPNSPTGVCPGTFACVERGCATPCANDQDCDGIADSDEGLNLSPPTDTDGDGVPDGLDHDSDGDTIPDAVEAGDRDLSTPPLDTGNKGTPNFRSLDSDSDLVADQLEAGPAPGVPRDTDSDGIPDYIDTDSDNDGILDRCEARDAGGRLCGNSTLITVAQAALLADTDADGVPDLRDLDSDGDGVIDAIEARAKPSDATTLASSGVDHDGDGTPDYRDLDSDNDTVGDHDEDKNGDGIVNCQVDGSGNVVPDSRPAPTCGSTSAPYSSQTPYDYNPGCPLQKCLLAETNRVFGDTDGNGIGDGQDGINYVCSAANLKPINLFYSQGADYALALEQTYTTATRLNKSGSQVGLTFDDPNNSNGSYVVRGLVLSRTPSAAAIGTTNADPKQALQQKAVAQAQADKTTVAGISGVTGVSLVLSRNFTSFDGYGVALSRYSVTTSSSITAGKLRDQIAIALGGSFDSFAAMDAGPADVGFTLNVETLYRWDDGNSQGRVLAVAAVTPTGASSDAVGSYSYRTKCSAQGSQSACQARSGCAWSGSACSEIPGFQIPLFFADNISNGSALTQYGDDLASICQSLVQRNSVLDVLWTVDDSGSMADKIGQVVRSSALFFPFLNNSEADYRVAMTTTSNNGSGWSPVFPGTPVCSNYATQTNCTNTQGCVWNNGGCSWGGCSLVTTQSACTNTYRCVWNGSSCGLAGYPDLINGALSGDFTGAVAGKVNLSATDRTANYSCSQGCLINSCTSSNYTTAAACNAHAECTWNTTTSACVNNCCPTCLNNGSSVPNDPACYFAARLPNDIGSGYEHGSLMTEWAMYRAGAVPTCAAAPDAGTCGALAGCVWDGGACIQAYCALTVPPSGSRANSPPRAECNGWEGSSQPAASNFGAAEIPADCEWNPLGAGGNGSCFPTMGKRCNTASSQALCSALGPRCTWTSGLCVPNEPANRTMCNGTSQAVCVAQGFGTCQWDSCGYSDSASCREVAGCAWNGSACGPVAYGGTCRPPLKRMMRANATKLAVMVSDEEDCYVKDGPNSNSGGAAYDGNCAGGQYTGGLNLYSDPVRLQRVSSYGAFLRGRDVLAYALVGDKADPTQAPATTTVLGNGGCRNTLSNGQSYTAEAGQGYIAPAEGTGGGWGSLCATDLYPSIEAVALGALSKASPYKLNGFIAGSAVQPISSTIKVAVQTCVVPSEYPSCASGTQVVVVNRSRDSGFDYDAGNNALMLYGAARPVTAGSVTVSYRYWVNEQQPPQGNPSCPCPGTSGPGCACPPGKACGTVGGSDHCAAVTQASACPSTPGCVWNNANGGFCETTGLCAPDPTCGGVACQAGYKCDPKQGLCACDVSCGGACNPGSTCDNNANINSCAGKAQGPCNATSGCAFNATLNACLSATCGQCVCDVTCGGGCPAGDTCDSNTGSATCGQCVCDTQCGGGCPTHETCDTDPSSARCGLCQPPSCGTSCPAGYVCSPSSQICVCDTTCGGGSQTPPAGQSCDTNPSSPTCGQLVCDRTCGGSCPAHELCQSDPNSTSCGFCYPDPQCGEPGGNCNPGCSSYAAQAACAGDPNCRWKTDANGNLGCYPQACQVCDSTTGQCAVSAQCTGCSCNAYESCQASTGSCVCDTTCKNSCGTPGQFCDRSTASPTCGQCVCDTTCGGPCQSGQKCDVDPNSGTCGTCIIDPNCGQGCAYPLVCDPTTGLCGPDQQCGGCNQAYVCDISTGKCLPPGG